MKPSEKEKLEAQIAVGLISADDLRKATVELCHAGLLTCTRGAPGEPSATYAVGWLPLDDPGQYPAEMREQHVELMRRALAGRSLQGKLNRAGGPSARPAGKERSIA